MLNRKKYRKRPIHSHTLKRLEYISQYFRDYRFITGYSRESFADENNINRRFIECLESKNNNPTLLSVFYLCDLYGITPSDLFHELE